MRVLFLMFAFPDTNKSFNMYTALVDYFHRNSHDVIVLAPNVGKKTELRKENGIDVLRVKTLPIKNVSVIRKGISNIFLPYQYKKQLKAYFPDDHFDCIIIPTPPITLGGLATNLKRKHKAKIYLVLRDIFPQNAVDLRFMKKGGLMHRYFKGKENKLYQAADFIGAMSQANVDYIRKHHNELDPKKIHILRNWQYKYVNHNVDKEAYRTKYNLNDKFVIVFGGNMGKPQQLENVLQLAEAAQELKNVLILMLGEGVRMQQFKKEIELRGIENIRIQSTIPKQEYQELLSVCDVGLISLHQDFTIPNIPSKALDYFNVGIPVLASLDRTTDFGQILDDERAGLWVYAGEHSQLLKNLLKLYQDKELRTELGRNGKAYFNKYLTPQTAYQTVINYLHGDRPGNSY